MHLRCLKAWSHCIHCSEQRQGFLQPHIRPKRPHRTPHCHEVQALSPAPWAWEWADSLPAALLWEEPTYLHHLLAKHAAAPGGPRPSQRKRVRAKAPHGLAQPTPGAWLPAAVEMWGKEERKSCGPAARGIQMVLNTCCNKMFYCPLPCKTRTLQMNVRVPTPVTAKWETTISHLIRIYTNFSLKIWVIILLSRVLTSESS